MKVSVCTSVLNQSDFLRRQIASVVSQTFKDWEHIIVDDGSTEDIEGLVRSFHDSRLVYIRLNTGEDRDQKSSNRGFNYAYSMATGEYINALSADEFLWDRKFEVQVAWMDKHPEIGCTWGLPTPDIGKKWNLGPCEPFEQHAYRAHNRSREAWTRTLMTLENTAIGGASMLMRRSCYLDIGGYDIDMGPCTDLEWFVRFFQKYEGWILPYRFADADHPAGSVSRPITGQKELFDASFKRLHEKHKIALPASTGHVTVGIPVKDMAGFIGKTLDCLKAQSFQDFYIKILDDGGTDDLASALLPYADLSIELLRFDENRGTAHAFNQLLARTETEFFVSIAADDLVEPTFLERCLAEFKRDPWLEMVATQTDFIDEDGVQIPAGTHQLQNIPAAANRSREHWLEVLRHGNHYFGVSIYRTDALRALAGLDTDAGILADYDLYLKLLMRENIHVIEEKLTHTRIHGQMQSFGAGKFTQQWLRDKYHEIKSRYYAPRMKVIIATPFYEMRGFSPYIASLTQTCRILTQMNIDWDFWELSGDSYVDRAKNTLVNKFLEDPSATDLFMIDSDMQWDVNGFFNMLQAPEAILMGSYPQKNAWNIWTARPVLVEGENGKLNPRGRMLPDGTAIIQAEYLAGGFLRMKRQALQAYKDHYKDFIYYDQGADPSCPERLYTEFFTCQRETNEAGTPLRWGEDRIFGRRMQAIGVESFIYPNVHMGHYGIKGWTGNYDKFLRDPEAGKVA